MANDNNEIISHGVALVTIDIDHRNTFKIVSIVTIDKVQQLDLGEAFLGNTSLFNNLWSLCVSALLVYKL